MREGVGTKQMQRHTASLATHDEEDSGSTSTSNCNNPSHSNSSSPHLMASNKSSPQSSTASSASLPVHATVSANTAGRRKTFPQPQQSQPSRMKRSPYLSVMATRNAESEDLVELLSRPPQQTRSLGDGGSVTSEGGGGGSAGFFHLKRPSSSMLAMEDGHPEDPSGQPRNSSYNNIPSLKSALRVPHHPYSPKAHSSSEEGDMKKNASVTFSQNTKHPSRLGLQDRGEEEGGANNDAFPLFSKAAAAAGGAGGVMMMRKSQSICAPEYLLAHSHIHCGTSISGAGGSSSSASGAGAVSSSGGSGDVMNIESGNVIGRGAEGNGGGGGGNASFPIYFAKLDGGGKGEGQPPPPQPHHVPQPPQVPSPNHHPTSSNSPGGHVRQKSKSMNTLQYSYQNEELYSTSSSKTTTSAAGNKLFSALGINPSSRVNLTFRDMLDEGDGTDGDLNLRLRNQQWKDFRMFSKEFESGNPMLASIDEGGGGNSSSDMLLDTNESQTTTTTTSLSGSKRSISPSSNNPSSSSLSSSNNININTAAAFMNTFGSHRQLNSHRASVSVNDLAMLRRSAARMRLVGPTSTTTNSASAFATTTTTLPGAILGGEMLQRASSRNSSNSSIQTAATNSSSRGDVVMSALSPLAQMMAKSANLSSRQQQDLFLGTVNYQLSSAVGDAAGGVGTSSGLMGRRARTVGAGLAYGGPNLSRFDLGSLRKDLSITSGGSGSTGGTGKNEEWDL